MAKKDKAAKAGKPADAAPTEATQAAAVQPEDKSSVTTTDKTKDSPMSQKDPSKPDWALSRRERKAKARAEAGLPPKKKRGWIIALILVLLLLGGGWWYQNGGAEVLAAMQSDEAEAGDEAAAVAPEPEAEAAQDAVSDQAMQILPSELTEIETMRLRETVKATGALSPSQQAAISAEVSARVTEVQVRPGDRVEEGALLAQLDIEGLTNQLEQQRASAEATRAQLRLAETQLERTRSLLGRGLTPESQLDAGQANVDQLAASLAAQEKGVANAEENLAHARITAPFTGVVSSRSVDPGSYVSVGSPLVALVDLTVLEFEAAVPVRYTPRLAAGQKVELTVEGVGDHGFTGTVDRIAPVAIEGTRMLPVYVSIENPDGLLRGGMFAAGRVVLEETAEAIGIPADALREDDAGTFVLKRQGDLVVRQGVEVARSWEGGRMVEIASGLELGDVIVSQPLDQLRPDTQILVVGE
ncbi:nodulation-related efflux transporter subunit NolF [Pseudooceanicola antarcticus]|uniref:Efflux RND transporter periplasmic adaptor subunit n=1 Tax=Pseudooceanicola antarcticus TaxID=1247613 RepID=A0A285IK66_9RHOB|nr:efflux RND transporter periplasmic adaptor subunit [Pseudooceanicola antarcticus]PJE28758.1 efflux RND transporter periplasmic adaptor subunit [Pseudooceanicola antarcticus]SNY48342.1 nodulation-related efflux transporter subunit NolF [Pseudooceanicola antarcticus]